MAALSTGIFLITISLCTLYYVLYATSYFFMTYFLTKLVPYPIPMWNYRDSAIKRIEDALKPVPPTPTSTSTSPTPPVKKTYRHIFRQSLLKTARLESDDEIDEYVDKLRDQLKMLLKGSDGIDLK